MISNDWGVVLSRHSLRHSPFFLTHTPRGHFVEQSYTLRRTHPSRGKNISAPVGSALPQTTSVGEVTSEVHTSVEAPRNTRQNRNSDCVYKPRESLKSYIGVVSQSKTKS
jgi:hypothetical protein